MNLDEIVVRLNERKQRATYGAVAGLLGVRLFRNRRRLRLGASVCAPWRYYLVRIKTPAIKCQSGCLRRSDPSCSTGPRTCPTAALKTKPAAGRLACRR